MKLSLLGNVFILRTWKQFLSYSAFACVAILDSKNLEECGLWASGKWEIPRGPLPELKPPSKSGGNLGSLAFGVLGIWDLVSSAVLE